MSASGALTHLMRPRLEPSATTRRLIVTWQHPVRRSIHAVGLLEYDGSTYLFRYVRRALSVRDFRPFPGFPHLHQRYESDRLFPLFAQRVMDARRPDYPRFLTALDLPMNASPWEVLSRSEGHRIGDTIQVFPEPVIEPDGRTWCRFLVHGIRHILREHTETALSLASLRPGQPLRLVDDITNPKNPRAVLTTAEDGQPLGWAPDLMLDYLHTVRRQDTFTVVVERVNGPDTPPHLRLLVRLAGHVPAGYRPFTGADWEPLT